MKVDTAIAKRNFNEGIGFTNRDAFLGGLEACEFDPTYDRLSRLSDPFHGEAVAESTFRGLGKLRVCDSCAIRLARINGGGK